MYVTVLRYRMEYKNSEGDLVTAEVDVDCENLKVPKDSLDEFSRRYLIAQILEHGGRVLKIKRMNG